MNIQDYYRKTASVSLNASLASLVPPVFFILFGLIFAPNKNIVIMLIPFLIYSFVCFHFYLLNEQRSKEIVTVHKNLANKSLLDEDQVLLTFMPAPTLRMLVFNTNGQQIAEIKDMNFSSFRWFIPYFADRLLTKSYRIYDSDGQVIGSFSMKNRHLEVTEMNSGVMEKISCKHTINGSCYFVFDQEKEIVVKHTALFTDYQFFINNSLVGRIRKGWLPKECDTHYRDPNTPVFTFDKKLSKEDRLLLFAIGTKLLRCSNH